MLLFFLANFCFLLSVGLVTTSEFWAIAGILGTNTAVPVFMKYHSAPEYVPTTASRSPSPSTSPSAGAAESPTSKPLKGLAAPVSVVKVR